MQDIQNPKIAQSLWIQQSCRGIFSSGTLVEEPSSNFLDQFDLAWKHCPDFDETQLKYLFLYLKGEDLSQFSSEPEDYKSAAAQIDAQRKACITAKINILDACFFDVLPKPQLVKWLSHRELALQNLYQKVKKPTDYDILHKIHVLVTNISNQVVNYNSKQGRVLYNVFGSATGRLTTKRGSVPVLTLKKDQRGLLKPQNDAFVELDLNAAEIRMLMALSGREQPGGDIHEWVVDNVFENSISRKQAKLELFSWLYNPSNSKSRFDKIFSREIFRDFYFSENETLKTPFGRQLKVEERKAQNYLLQSSTSDQVLENAYEIQKILMGKKSNIAFTLHDSIILDMSRNDAIMLRDIKKQFETTRWGNFASSCKIGKTFGTLKEIKI